MFDEYFTKPIIAVNGLILTILIGTSASTIADDFSHNVVYQSAKDAMYEDISILAKQAELDVDAVEKSIVFQNTFAKFAEQVNKDFPDSISGLWVDPTPQSNAVIRFKGDVPHEVKRSLEYNQLPGNVVLKGGDILSLADQLSRVNILRLKRYYH